MADINKDSDRDSEFESWWKEKTSKDDVEYRHKFLLRVIDVAAAALLILCTIGSLGTYMRITQFVILFNVLFIILRMLLKLGVRTKVKQVFKQILRFTAVVVSVCYLLVLLPLDRDLAFMYPIRKAVFEIGEYRSAYLSGLPESLPAKTDGFTMNFVSNTIFPGDREYVTLTFVTDSEGAGKMLAKAQSLISGEVPAVYTEKAGSFTDDICADNGLDGSGLDVYAIPPNDLSETGYIYAVSETTGLCIIHWERNLFK